MNEIEKRKRKLPTDYGYKEIRSTIIASTYGRRKYEINLTMIRRRWSKKKKNEQ